VKWGKIVVLIVLFSLSSFALSECVIVKSMEGYSVREKNGFDMLKDKISGDFVIVIDGENSNVRPENNMDCKQASGQTVICQAIRKDRVVVEIWSIYDDQVVLSRMREGAPFLNGADLFVGEIDGRCD
jgi:hypothetical protein